MKFEVKTKLGFKVSCTTDYWKYIVKVKHPHMKDKDEDVVETLKRPETKQARQERLSILP